MKTSVIVTSFNNTFLSAHMTMACVRQINMSTDSEDYELILVDPVPSKGTHVPVRDDYHVLKIDKWLKPDPDPGYAACVNLGAENAEGEYLAFVQNDAFVMEGWLTGICKYLDNGYDLIWPCQIPRTRADVLAIEKRDWFDPLSLHGWRDEGLFVIKKKAWEKVGGYDPTLSILVQREFLTRMEASGIKWADINKVRYIHLMAGTNTQLMQSDPDEYDAKIKKDADKLND